MGIKLISIFYLFSFFIINCTGEVCLTPNNIEGECILLSHCQVLYKKFLAFARERKVHEYTEFLKPNSCDNYYDSRKNSGEILLLVSGLSKAKFCCPNEIHDEVSTVDKEDFVFELPAPPVCGVSTLISNRIAGEGNAKEGEFPWSVLLGHKYDKLAHVAIIFLCGGSLITHKHILTAAHCVKPKKTINFARLGTINIDQRQSAKDHKIKKLMKHPDFFGFHINDIALAVLLHKIIFTDHIKPICLPTFDINDKHFEGNSAILAGFGKSSHMGEHLSHLKYSSIPILSELACKKAFSDFLFTDIDESVLCAGGNNVKRKACHGDSGGALVTKMEHQMEKFFYQIGIVSFSTHCGLKPTGFTRISSYLPWIYKHVLGSVLLDYEN